MFPIAALKNLSLNFHPFQTLTAAALLTALISSNAIPSRAQGQARSNAERIESGVFRIYKLQYPVGEESYEVTREGDSLVTQSRFAINYLGDDVSLAATLVTGVDLRPRRFSIKGKTSTRSETDVAVEINGTAALIREGGRARTVNVREPFFPVEGLLPVSTQGMMFRFRAGHGKAASLRTLPEGRVGFEHRGRDRVALENKSLMLERYSVSGIVWGRETVWLDEAQNLVAVVSPDAELDRLEAVREGYEALLPFFVRRAAEDAVVDLERISKRIPSLREGRFAVVGGLLIDGTGKPPVADSIVVVENGRITAAGSRSEVKIPKGANVFDARGKAILPGLWDMHAHAEQGEWIPASLAAGITTMRDAGNEPEFILPLRDAIRSGRIVGPRLLLAGIIDSPPHPLGNVTAETPEQARAAVRRYKQLGYEQIKIYQSLKPELVSVIATEAHRLGMSVTGHVPTGMDAAQAVEAGVDQINHVGFLLRVMRGRGFRLQPGVTPPPLNLQSPEAQAAIRFFKERRTVIDPTLARSELNRHPRATPFVNFEPSMTKIPVQLFTILNNSGLPPEIAPRAAAGIELERKLTIALFRAGVPVVAGTDLVVPGHSIYRELELYVGAGMTPMEAIQTATIIPARAMKMDEELGTIEADKLADLIILDGNPLESISNLRKVKFVVAKGRMYDCASLWESVGFRP